MTTATPNGTLSRSALLALPATIDVETAGRAFGIGRTTAYALAKSGAFPCRVLRAGKAYRVVTEDLLRVLHITPDNGDGAGGPAPTPLAERTTATT
ncbi:integrase [Streptomyces sp. SID12488]|uniref:integrase n=1 Tax=Streptomyces sp. SID12488 TaxID=2706040 RepID=UPI001EF284CA|nr:integrase [Streptomyces sp. SID12488]